MQYKYTLNIIINNRYNIIINKINAIFSASIKITYHNGEKLKVKYIILIVIL